jgi:phasin family protein
MTTKTTKTAENIFGADRFQAAFGEINERAKAASEKGAKLVEEMTDLTRGNVEALVASSRVAQKGFETLSQGAAEFGRKSFGEIRSATDFFKLQGDFARSAFDAAVAESARMSEQMLKIASDAAEPINSRYTVAAERVKKARRAKAAPVKTKRPTVKAAARKAVRKTVRAAKRIQTQGVVTMNKQTKDGFFAADQFKTVFGDANERAKTAMEKGAKIAEEIADLTRGNVEAIVASSKVAAKGVETLSQDAAEFGRKSFEEASATLKSFAEVKSATDFFKLQSDYARSAFDAAVAETARASEAFLKIAGDVAEPITSRYTVAAERVKTLAA